MQHWRDEEQEQTFRAFLFAAQALFEQFDRVVQRDADVPLAYFQILACLSQAPERSRRMGDVAEHLHASRSRLSHSIARLEERGWVQRVACPADKRVTYAVLTDQGLAVFEAAAPGLVQCAREQLFDRLSTSQVAELRLISEALAAQLAPSRDS